MNPALKLFEEQGRIGLNADELAVTLGVHPSTIRRAGIHKTYVGRRVIYTLDHIAEYLDKNTVKAAQMHPPMRQFIRDVVPTSKPTLSTDEWAVQKDREWFGQ